MSNNFETFVVSVPDRINSWVRNMIEKGVPNGLFCTAVDEPIPSFEVAPCEKVIHGQNDSSIVLGRDRTSSLASGCGGKGITQSGMIDLVCGRLASVQSEKIRKSEKLIDKNQKVNPNFAADAARIYITQKTLNIDEDFGFKKQKGSSSLHKSAIGIKSDHTRIIGRESVRIYAGLGRWEGVGNKGETCANGETIPRGSGKIEFVGGNASEDKLQPAVLGDKLKEYLKEQSDKMIDIYDDLLTINQQLSKLNAVVGGLTQDVGMVSSVVTNIEKMSQKVKDSLSTKLEQFKSLEAGPASSKKSFLSKDVFLT